MFEEKNPGKMYIVYWYHCYTHTFLSCLFIFTSLNTTSLTLLVNIVLIRNCKSVNSDQFRWANVYVQVSWH